MEHNNNENNLNSNNESNSLYSYSYLNQENQERNPNYYEKQEEQGQGASGGQPGSNERTYVAGVSAEQGYARNDQQFYTTGQASQGEGQFQENGQAYSSQWNPAPEGKKKKQKKHHGFGATLEIGRAHV